MPALAPATTAAAAALATATALALLTAPTPAAAALRCYSYAVRVPNQAFGYKAGFPTWKPDCDPQYYNISKLYMKYACIADRANSFTTRPASCPGGLAVLDGSTETCTAVFGYGPKGAFTRAADITGGSGFDSGNVCNGGDQGYFFIVADDKACPSPTPPKVVAAPYAGPKCNRQAGGTAMATGKPASSISRSPGKIAGISIGAALFLLLLTGGVCWAIYYMSQRAGGKPSGAVQSAMMGMGGGGAAGAAGGAALPPGSYVPGGAAPAAGAGAGAGGAGAGGYSYAPAAAGGKAGSKPTSGTGDAAAAPAVGMPLGPAGAGGAPGKVAYPKV